MARPRHAAASIGCSAFCAGRRRRPRHCAGALQVKKNIMSLPLFCGAKLMVGFPYRASFCSIIYPPHSFSTGSLYQVVFNHVDYCMISNQNTDYQFFFQRWRRPHRHIHSPRRTTKPAQTDRHTIASRLPLPGQNPEEPPRPNRRTIRIRPRRVTRTRAIWQH